VGIITNVKQFAYSTRRFPVPNRWQRFWFLRISADTSENSPAVCTCRFVVLSVSPLARSWSRRSLYNTRRNGYTTCFVRTSKTYGKVRERPRTPYGQPAPTRTIVSTLPNVMLYLPRPFMGIRPKYPLNWYWPEFIRLLKCPVNPTSILFGFWSFDLSIKQRNIRIHEIGNVYNYSGPNVFVSPNIARITYIIRRNT